MPAREGLEEKLEVLKPRLEKYLPNTLRLKLDTELTKQDLTEIAQSLESLQHNLQTYLPRKLHTPANLGRVPKGGWVEGTALFADVTGFTPLTEHLRQLGDEGAEQLNKMINDLFAAILGPLTHSHGELLIFAGDAILAYFPKRSGDEDALWAARAGLRMVRAIAPFDALPVPLSMSVGLARGRFFEALVGSTQRRELLNTGGPIQQSMLAEGMAEPGEVSLAPNIAPLLEEHFNTRLGPDGHSIIIDDLGEELDTYELSRPTARRRRGRLLLLESDPLAIAQAVEESLVEIETLSLFFPPDILHLIMAHQQDRQFPGEHRLVSVMFVNLRGFETLLEMLDPEGIPILTNWINDYFNMAWETINNAGGLISHIDPYAKGFTLLCPFGAPLTGEEMPKRAVAAALQLNTHLERLKESLQKRLRTLPDISEDLITNLPLAHHIGITYGPIYTGSTGWQERREYVILGDDVNLSARLMNKTEPNQILISGWVYEQVDQAFECKTLPPVKLKGKSKPVPIYEVLRQRLSTPWLTETAKEPLIGREVELEKLENFLGQLQTERGGIITLIGETGMGKTRLAAAVASQAQQRGITVLAGRCLSYAQATPYIPWIEAFWRWLQLENTNSLAAQREKIQQQLAMHNLNRMIGPLTSLLIPAPTPGATLHTIVEQKATVSEGVYDALQQQLDTRTADEAASTGQPDGLYKLLNKQLQQRTPQVSQPVSLWTRIQSTIKPGQVTVDLLTALSQKSPVLCIIEDLQWSDQASWETLLKLAATVSNTSILILVTARPGPETDEWVAKVKDLSQKAGTSLWSQAVLNVAHFELEGLSPTGTAVLAAAILNTQPAMSLVNWLYNHTQGIPLFITQVLYTLKNLDKLERDAKTGQIVLRDELVTLPPTVREIMLSRVDRLPEEIRTICKIAAVIGESIPADLLAQHTSFTLETLLKHIEVLAEQSFIRPRPPALEYAFTHPLLREAIYASIPYAQRRAWHRAIADVIAKDTEENIYQNLETLAHHYTLSEAAIPAIRYNRLAGNKARKHQAWKEATGYYQRALQITGSDPNIPVERSRTYEAWGDLLALSGDYPKAFDTYQAAIALQPGFARWTVKQKLLLPLLDKAYQDSAELWELRTTIDTEEELYPWLIAACGWLAYQSQDLEHARTYWEMGFKQATTTTAQTALNALLKGDIPPHYEILLKLILESTAEKTGQ
ncbi:MAG: AAA family ATPase [Anaerolineae bacterium]|nr:AAA family ATPase [Anaerolineae bacterium]